MKAIYDNNVSITLATIIGNAILPHSNGSVESRHLDALSVNPEAYKKIVANRKVIIAQGSFEKATLKAKELIAA